MRKPATHSFANTQRKISCADDAPMFEVGQAIFAGTTFVKRTAVHAPSAARSYTTRSTSSAAPALPLPNNFTISLNAWLARGQM